MALRLRGPRPSFFHEKLALVELNPDKLIRISRHNTGEPYFGKSGGNRFDDPEPEQAKRYGTCYFGLSLSVAVAETLLHNEEPVRGHFVVHPDEIALRYVIRYAGKTLTLADLTGAALRRAGAHAQLTGTPNYKIPQKWSKAIHQNNHDAVDGFVYMSRHLNTEKAVVLFDRAASKLSMVSAEPLDHHPALGPVIDEFRIVGSRNAINLRRK